MLGELTNVDGNQSMDEVAEEIYKVLDNLKIEAHASIFFFIK